MSAALDIVSGRRFFITFHSYFHTVPKGHPKHQRCPHTFIPLRSRYTGRHFSSCFKRHQITSAASQHRCSKAPTHYELFSTTLPEVDDPGVLGEVLEVREIIENAEGERDLKELKVENGTRIEQSIGILAGLFEKGDLDAAKDEAVKLRYWVNIKQALDEWEPGKPVVLIH